VPCSRISGLYGTFFNRIKMRIVLGLGIEVVHSVLGLGVDVVHS